MSENTNANTRNLSSYSNFIEKKNVILSEIQNHKNDFPQLMHLWEKIILKYEDNLLRILDECDNMLNHLHILNPNHDLREIYQTLQITNMVNNTTV
jgi:hypothetical protein